MLDLGVVGDHVAVVVEVDEVVRVQAVAAVDVLVGVDVAQREDDARAAAPCRVCAGTTAWRPFGARGEVAVLLDVAEQVHAEVVEAEVGDGDAGADVLELDDLVLELAQLLLAEGRVGAGRVEHVVVAVAGEVGDDHAVLDALLEVDVLVERDVGPEVHQLDAGVGRADAVDAAESLDDPHRVPVDVVVDEVVAVLEVLALADAVGADEHVELAGLLRHRQVALLRPWARTG